MSEGSFPLRSEVWKVDLGDTTGHEQSGIRPCLIISADSFNAGKSGLVIIAPLTGIYKDIPHNIKVFPPEGGVKMVSFIKCEDVRSISKDRLIERWGMVNEETMRIVEDWLRILLEL